MRAIDYSAQAKADITAVTEYLDAHSATASDRLTDEIDERCALLAAQPRIGRVRDDIRPGLRSTVVGKYLLFYRFTDTIFEVVRFLHGSRDLDAAFAEE